MTQFVGYRPASYLFWLGPSSIKRIALEWEMWEHCHSFRCARQRLRTGFWTGVLSLVSPHFESSGSPTCQASFSPASLDSLFCQPNPKSNSLIYEVPCTQESNFRTSWLRWHRQGQSTNITSFLPCFLLYCHSAITPPWLRLPFGCQNLPETTQTELEYPFYTIWIPAGELMPESPTLQIQHKEWLDLGNFL